MYRLRDQCRASRVALVVGRGRPGRPPLDEARLSSRPFGEMDFHDLRKLGTRAGEARMC